MAKTIVVCGYGPGISEAVARKFGGEGFQVALVARSEEKVRQGASALGDAGIEARGFVCDLGDPAAVKKMIGEVRSSLSAVGVIHYNAYAGLAGDLTTCDPAELRQSFDVGVTGAVVAIQESLADLKAQDGAAILVTGGGLALYSDEVDAMAVGWNAMGLAVAKAAQHKLVGLLHHKLKGEGIYVGEVVVLGMVKGTAFDQGNATLDPADIAGAFWTLYQERSPMSVRFPG
jgi:NADP-dependent 3-hydroxy acid dehydrogenase YdfG